MTTATSSTDGTFATAWDAAEAYLGRGFVPIQVPYRQKGIPRKDWQHERPTPDSLDGLFPAGIPSNVGLLLGEPSGGLVDIDLDCQEAVRAAEFLLPATGMVSGRAGKPRSHFWYTVDNPAAEGKRQIQGHGQRMVRRTGSGE